MTNYFRAVVISATLLFLGGGLCSCQASNSTSNDTVSEATESLPPVAGQSIDFIFFGDAMQHQAQLDRARELGKATGEYDYSEYYTLLEPEIKKADYAVVNLEVPLGGGNDYSGFPCFSAPDVFAATLKDAGFDMMLTANNHCLDRRDRGLRRTLHVLDSLDIDHIGTYRTSRERSELVPFIKNINGIKVGFLNYTYGTNGIEAKDGAEVSLIDRQHMSREIQATRNAGAELIIVLPHWGVEYVLNENQNQRDLAQFLIEQGVDMIIGSHPHVIQPFKVIHNDKENKDVLVVYSLGNVVSNMKTNDTVGGALVRAHAERDSDGKVRFKTADYDIFFSAKPDGPGSNFHAVPSWMPEKIPTSQRGKWDVFRSNALRIFNKNNINVGQRHKD